jgi:hypothetical protein
MVNLSATSLAKFAALFLLIASPFYFMCLHSIRGLDAFLARSVERSGSVVAFRRLPHSAQDAYYLLSVKRIAKLDPELLWTEGVGLSLRPGEGTNVYFDPRNPADARVLDGREVERYKAGFIYPALLCNAVFLLVWIGMGKANG